MLSYRSEPEYPKSQGGPRRYRNDVPTADRNEKRSS